MPLRRPRRGIRRRQRPSFWYLCFPREESERFSGLWPVFIPYYIPIYKVNKCLGILEASIFFSVGGGIRNRSILWVSNRYGAEAHIFDVFFASHWCAPNISHPKNCLPRTSSILRIPHPAGISTAVKNNSCSLFVRRTFLSLICRLLVGGYLPKNITPNIRLQMLRLQYTNEKKRSYHLVFGEAKDATSACM